MSGNSLRSCFKWKISPMMKVCRLYFEISIMLILDWIPTTVMPACFCIEYNYCREGVKQHKITLNLLALTVSGKLLDEGVVCLNPVCAPNSTGYYLISVSPHYC
uniref:uncharacterized protein LOC105353444 n=1 Tax=Fragaria vesca subsp. vesca TaxID=101020 RepID=UPI0005CB1871|nr:PREDICTED: uncharacterized protein LOC105353444 [Fragaria vesca subsp. vesca]